MMTYEKKLCVGVKGVRVNINSKTIFTGDNLPIMRGMNSESVDLIYLDPPFNSKANYAAPIGSEAAGAAFKDTWTLSDVDITWLDLIEAKHPALNRVIHAAMTNSDKSYLIYMAVRLLEMKRILKDTGSVYLHCDPTMSHLLKLVMDAVFGKRNFRSEITWKRATSTQKGSQHRSLRWGNNVDILLFYASSLSTSLSPERELTEQEIREKFDRVDENGRRYYDDSAHIWSSPNMGPRPNLCYEWRGFVNPHPSGWRLSKERLEEEYQKGNIVIRPDGKLERRKYLEDYKGASYGNLWDDILPASGNERTGYPTQKPVALLDRIIKASSNEGDVILDPFCGCATTLVAADRLQREWIGIDISAKAAELVVERIRDDQGMFEDIIARDDIPNRTDLGNIPRYNVPENKTLLYGEQGGDCNGCGEHFQTQHLEIDHIIAKSVGGTDHIENLQLLCGHCNRIKGDRGQEYLISRLNAS